MPDEYLQYGIKEYPGCLRFTIKASDKDTYEDITRRLDNIISIGSEAEDMELSTFVPAGNISETDFFLSNGFYIYNTMLFMEKELTKEPEITPGVPADIFFLESPKDSMEAYLEASSQAFEECTPRWLMDEELSNESAKLAVAMVSGQIVSSVTIWKLDEATWACENIFTVPQYRNKKLALAVLSFCEKEIAKKGGKKLKLSVYADDLSAVNMYYRKGFYLTGTDYELRY